MFFNCFRGHVFARLFLRRDRFTVATVLFELRTSLSGLMLFLYPFDPPACKRASFEKMIRESGIIYGSAMNSECSPLIWNPEREREKESERELIADSSIVRLSRVYRVWNTDEYFLDSRRWKLKNKY